jgi:hypothetical protein
MAHHPMISNEMQRGIDLTLECKTACLATISHCLQMGGKHADYSHIQLLIDSAETCRTVADFLARGSEYHGWMSGVCAEILKYCIDDLERFADDPSMDHCASVCRETLVVCRQLAGMSAGPNAPS